MPINISSDNPTFLLKNKITEITNEFLGAFQLNYFQYLRCYSNGSIGLLTNNTSLFECFQQLGNSPVVFSSFEEEQKNAHSYWFSWDEKLPNEPVNFVREKFNIHHGLTYVRRTKNYYDMIGFALPKNINDSTSFYLNKLKIFENFINQFDKENKELIAIMDQDPIELPEAYRDPNYKKMCLTSGRIVIQGRYIETYITLQELACAKLYIKGLTMKKIALMLDISHRSVETYLVRVKQRTGYNERSEIEKILIDICP